MAAYLVAQIKTISDAERYDRYRKAVAEVIPRFGGRYVIRGGSVEILEGGCDNQSLVVIEFPTMEALKAFYDSPVHQEIKKLREGIAVADLWAVPGFNSP